MEYKLFQYTCLRIYQIGLSRLMDNDWIISKFSEYLNIRIQRKKTPNDLFFSTLHDGILNNLGGLFFDELLAIEHDVFFCDAQTAFTRSAEVYYMLSESGFVTSKKILKLWLAIDAVDGVLVEVPEKRANSVFHRQQFHIDLHDALTELYEYYQNDIDELRKLYAKNFAERVFHDRQICEYISFGLTEMYEEKGFPTLDENGQIVIKPVERKTWPTWVKETLLARERGQCANCKKNFSELIIKPEIDHIVPLSYGGSNDVVNLQLLCWDCNHEKLDEKQLVNSSFPEYLKVWSKKGYKYPNIAKKSS